MPFFDENGYGAIRNACGSVGVGGTESESGTILEKGITNCDAPSTSQ